MKVVEMLVVMVEAEEVLKRRGDKGRAGEKL